MSIASESTILGERALRETLRTPDSLLPTLFIPLFFLVVNTGQAARIFPSDETPFLQGQNYAAFQLPVSMLLAASFGSAALYLVAIVVRDILLPRHDPVRELGWYAYAPRRPAPKSLALR